MLNLQTPHSYFVNFQLILKGTPADIWRSITQANQVWTYDRFNILQIRFIQHFLSPVCFQHQVEYLTIHGKKPKNMTPHMFLIRLR